jgi:hypothetical protein
VGARLGSIGAGILDASISGLRFRDGNGCV